MGRVVVGFLVVLLIGGCDRGGPRADDGAPPRYQTGADVRDALVRSGLGCDDFQPVVEHHRDYGEEDALETDTCRVANEDVSLSFWWSLGEKQDWARARSTLGCQFAAALGTPPPIYVDGGRWTIRTTSRMLATRIAQATGGDARFTDCRSVD